MSIAGEGSSQEQHLSLASPEHPPQQCRALPVGLSSPQEGLGLLSGPRGGPGQDIQSGLSVPWRAGFIEQTGKVSFPWDCAIHIGISGL